jgi:hypothetical protein
MAIHEHHVAANPKVWMGNSGMYRMIKRISGRHQRRGGKRTAGGQFHDRAVDSVREPEVIRVDNQSTISMVA